MPTVSASFNRPANALPYDAGDLICNVGAPVALEFTPSLVAVPALPGSPNTVQQVAPFCSARLTRANGAAPAAIRLVFLTRSHVYNPTLARPDIVTPVLQPVVWPAYTGTDNAAFPNVPTSVTLDTPRTLPSPRLNLPESFEASVQRQQPLTPIRVLLMALEPFVPLSGETFTLELSTDRTA